MATTNGTHGTQEKRPKWREPFLKALASSGNVLVSCRHANVKRRTAYNHRNQFPRFRDAWDEALEEHADAIEIEIVRRGIKGVDEPVYYKGEVCGQIRKYSDTLLIFYAKATRPEKFRDNYDLKKLADDLAALRAATEQPGPVPPKARGGGDPANPG